MENKWVLLLLFVTATTGSRRIADIGANLGRALDRSIQLENQTFTQHDSNVTNVMEVQFDPRGMQGLYNITKLFMDLVQKPDTLLPEGKNFKFHFQNNESFNSYDSIKCYQRNKKPDDKIKKIVNNHCFPDRNS